MPDTHVGDDAELYALGILDEFERKSIDRHAAACDACLRRLGEAEEAAARLAATLPQAEPSPQLMGRLAAMVRGPAQQSWQRYGAVAAGLLLAASLGQNMRFGSELGDQQAALEQVVHSHFNHASLAVAPAGAPMAAKVLYARDGSWLYLIVDRPPAGLQAFAADASGEHALGEPRRRGAVATLFVTHAGRPSRIVLRVQTVDEATAPLVY